MIPNKKSSIVLVLKVLEEYSDENHYLTQNEIIDLINKDYGIELERKSVGSSLQLLIDLDYDIVKGSKGGFALLSRAFDDTEASFIIDAIFSSRSISGKQAKKITDNLLKTFSKYKRRDYSYLYKTSEITRTSNKQVLYNISIINEAIKRNRRIRFQYLTYNNKGEQTLRMEGYSYFVSPYYLINNFGRYYLLCNYREKYGPLQIFRIDYMVNIEIMEDTELKPMSSLQDAPLNFSIIDYINEHIYLLSGETIKATISLDSESCVQNVIDWFGQNAKIHNENGIIYATITCNELALLYWVMQYSETVKVIAPELFVNKVKETLAKALKKYEN